MLDFTTYNPDRDIPDQSGKVIFVSGGTAGIGEQTILQLAKHNPAKIYFSGRNTKAAAAITDQVKAINPQIEAIFIQLDLTSLESIKSAITTNFTSPRLDTLVCAAGVMGLDPALTKDGYELQFGINHIGHALMIKLLLPTLVNTATNPSSSDVRVLIVSSRGFSGHPSGGIRYETLKTPQEKLTPILARWFRYGQSKAANVMYAAELSRQYPQLMCASIHPGVSNTGLVSNLSLSSRLFVWANTALSMISAEKAAWNGLWVITTDRSQLKSGTMYEPIGAPTKIHTAYTKDPAAAKKLWDWTEEQLKPFL